MDFPPGGDFEIILEEKEADLHETVAQVYNYRKQFLKV
jgi:hypothetical protein